MSSNRSTQLQNVKALFVPQVVHGWAFPNALMQYSLPELERLVIDLEELQHKRDRMIRELGAMGYQSTTPEGTFYLLVRSPQSDDVAFADRLASKEFSAFLAVWQTYRAIFEFRSQPMRI